MNNPGFEKCVGLNDDEYRLIMLYRSLAGQQEQHDFIRKLADMLFERHFPEGCFPDFMPHAGDIEPTGSIWDKNSLAYIIQSGIDATGDPSEVLFGSSCWDDEEAIPRFTFGIKRAASEQGNLGSWDRDFAATYIRAWRHEIVMNIHRKATAVRQLSLNSPDADDDAP